MIYAYSAAHLGMCGVGSFRGFNGGEGGAPIDSLNHCGGAAFVSTGFINNNQCLEAYGILCKRFDVIYQSPIRHNKNSGNMFFFTVFSEKGLPDVSPIDPAWPFK